MNNQKSGIIFRFSLEFDMGFGYAEQDDFSDVYTFDGILILVYKLIDKEIVDRSAEEIKQSGVLFGPVPIFRYPPPRGKNKWKPIHQTTDFLIKVWPVFKMYQGNDGKNKDWSKLLPKWRITDRSDSTSDLVFKDYETLRHIETTILNAAEGVAIKITMMKIIEEGKKVSDFYDLRLVGDRNMYLQLVNTYYDRETAETLLEDIGDEVIWDY